MQSKIWSLPDFLGELTALILTQVHYELYCTLWLNSLQINVHFLSQVIFIFLLFLGMVIYAN